ncbi:MAG: ligase-associated DNA damage response exonuclease [Halofilum sp. (in: g-proteobacteria)]
MTGSSGLLELRHEGLYCPPADWYIDPWRAVARALVTHAHGDHARPGSTRYIAARPARTLLERRLPNAAIDYVDYGETLQLGDARISLHPAGHVLGSAQVRVESNGRVAVVSGDYKRQPDPTCTPFEVVPCDTFVTEATFALPAYRWRPASEVAAELAAWYHANRHAGRCTVVFCYALGKAQRLLAELAPWLDGPVYLHGALRPLVEAYREAGVALPETAPVNDRARGDWRGQLVFAVPSAAGSTWMRRFGDCRTAAASGWMRVRGNRRRRGYDRGFVLSDHVDWPGLLRTIDDTGCSRVLATHGRTDVLVRYLQEVRGLEAAPLDTLWGEEDEAGGAA